MALPSEFNVATYNALTDAEKASVREDVFRLITRTGQRLDTAHANGAALMSDIDALATFVTAVAGDFSAGEQTDLVAARLRLRHSVAGYANGVNGVSSATAS